MTILLNNWPSWCLLLVTILIRAQKIHGADDDYNLLHRDGSYQFGYNTPDSYHHADANRNNVVRGEFGARNPGTGQIDSTIYTAGPRGFRPQGKNIVRNYDLNQNGPRPPIGSRDDPYFDPYEDPSYKFAFRTPTYQRSENANRRGDVTGKYSYLDDVGERHNVEFIAGKTTGFHVKTPFPDSNPRAYGPLYFRGRGKPIPRGRTSIQRGLDGSYRFVSTGPDQRRTETSDPSGHVRGSYTYLDDKGVQHSVHYIAGPETGYQVLKNVKGPHLPTIFPFDRPNIIPSDFYDADLFDTAATGHGVKPGSTNKRPGVGTAGSKDPTFDAGIDIGPDDFDKIPTRQPGVVGGSTTKVPGRPSKPVTPTYGFDGGSDSDDDFGDNLFGGPSSTGGGSSSSGAGTTGDDGSYKPSGPDDGLPRPGLGQGTKRPARPLPGKPSDSNYDYNDANNLGDDGLFGSDSSSRPPVLGGGTIAGNTGGSYQGGGTRPGISGTRPVIQIAGPHGGGGGPCDQCQGAVVTNIGDKTFSVPPGSSVRAHVQSIDLRPLMTKVPSPSEQFSEDMSAQQTEQLNSASSNVYVSSTTQKTSPDRGDQDNVTDSGVSSSTTTTTTIVVPTEQSIVSNGGTTQSTNKPTKAGLTAKPSAELADDNEDIDIF